MQAQASSFLSHGHRVGADGVSCCSSQWQPQALDQQGLVVAVVCVPLPPWADADLIKVIWPLHPKCCAKPGICEVRGLAPTGEQQLGRGGGIGQRCGVSLPVGSLAGLGVVPMHPCVHEQRELNWLDRGTAGWTDSAFPVVPGPHRSPLSLHLSKPHLLAVELEPTLACSPFKIGN